MENQEMMQLEETIKKRKKLTSSEIVLMTGEELLAWGKHWEFSGQGESFVTAFLAQHSKPIDEIYVQYTTEHGLADNLVASIAIDTDGVKWFGTYGGYVSRFDGETWTTYTVSDGLADNNVRTIAIDRDGVWINEAGLTLDFIDAEFLHVIVIPAVYVADIGIAFCDQFRPVETISGQVIAIIPGIFDAVRQVSPEPHDFLRHATDIDTGTPDIIAAFDHRTALTITGRTFNDRQDK